MHARDQELQRILCVHVTEPPSPSTRSEAITAPPRCIREACSHPITVQQYTHCTQTHLSKLGPHSSTVACWPGGLLWLWLCCLGWQ